MECPSMSEEASASPKPALSAFNYCACFLDILGQRHALRDQGLLPVWEGDEGRLKFIREVLAKTILPITRLQSQADTFLSTFINKSPSQLRASLPPEQQKEWDKLNEQHIRIQYWSDGLVAFSCLGNKEPSAQINGAFTLLGMAGSLCLMNLSYQMSNPLRGGIEIAWGSELREGELYGPAIARSYELESEIAQYPRIAVGAKMIEFLKTVKTLSPTDNIAKYSSMMAQTCLDMLVKDQDGQWMIHYLGDAFQQSVTRETHVTSYSDALRFVEQEYTRFRSAGDSKLAMRYFRLLSYFKSFPPKSEQEKV